MKLHEQQPCVKIQLLLIIQSVLLSALQVKENKYMPILIGQGVLFNFL